MPHISRISLYKFLWQRTNQPSSYIRVRTHPQTSSSKLKVVSCLTLLVFSAVFLFRLLTLTSRENSGWCPNSWRGLLIFLGHWINLKKNHPLREWWRWGKPELALYTPHSLTVWNVVHSSLVAAYLYLFIYICIFEKENWMLQLPSVGSSTRSHLPDSSRIHRWSSTTSWRGAADRTRPPGGRHGELGGLGKLSAFYEAFLRNGSKWNDPHQIKYPPGNPGNSNFSSGSSHFAEMYFLDIWWGNRIASVSGILDVGSAIRNRRPEDPTQARWERSSRDTLGEA